MNCPDCKNTLIPVDTLGIFPFHSTAQRIRFVVMSALLAVVWSVLVIVLVPENLLVISLLAFYAASVLLIHRIYRSKRESVVFECSECRQKFKGSSPIKFSYGEIGRETK